MTKARSCVLITPPPSRSKSAKASFKSIFGHQLKDLIIKKQTFCQYLIHTIFLLNGNEVCSHCHEWY